MKRHWNGAAMRTEFQPFKQRSRQTDRQTDRCLQAKSVYVLHASICEDMAIISGAIFVSLILSDFRAKLWIDYLLVLWKRSKQTERWTCLLSSVGMCVVVLTKNKTRHSSKGRRRCLPDKTTNKIESHSQLLISQLFLGKIRKPPFIPLLFLFIF